MRLPRDSGLLVQLALSGLAVTLVVSPGAKGAGEAPAGSAATRVAPGDVPLNLLETPDGFLITTNSGYNPHYLQAYDEKQQRVSDRLRFESLWYGLDYEPRHKIILASDGNHGVWVVRFKTGRFSAPRRLDIAGCRLPAGLALENQTTAVVACNQSHEVARFDIGTGRVLKRAQVGEFPYAVKRLADGRMAVSNWGQASVSILDGSSLEVLETIPVGSHPSDMLELPERNQLLVACSDSDLVSILDTSRGREVRRLNIQIPGSTLGGVQPDALAFDPDTARLFVALAAVDAVAVFEFGRGEDAEIKFQGLLPVGADPTALLHSARAHTLWIADGRNATTGPSSPVAPAKDLSPPPEGHRHHGDTRPRKAPGDEHTADSGSPLRYIGTLLGGGVEMMADSDFGRLEERMLSVAARIYGAKPQGPSPEVERLIRHFSAQGNPQAPLQHVIYIIKENRTYDQVFGDVREGNGAGDLVLFGEAVTPNQHRLARQFVLFDNFYVDGDVSADGHVWSTAASSTDYVNKLWPTFYAGRLKYDFLGPNYDGDDRHDRPFAAPASGFIWDSAQRAGITYRDYGEWCIDDKTGTTRAYLAGLKDHYDPRYLDDIGSVSDQQRIDEWEREFREFEKTGDLPRLTILHLPNDHTVGTTPGRPAPRAMVADNDLALGRLVEAVSHSRFWPETAIFVLEDDAQDGPDHVDAHRSPLLVISPYVRHGAVEHARFSTVSVLKAIEQILGLGSLTYFDDRTPSLLADFEVEPTLEPYTHSLPQVPLDELNRHDAPGAHQSAAWDFSRPDGAPEQELNRVIWQSVKGKDSEPPAPVFSVQSSLAVRSGWR